ncbi:hypothetical protein EI94DRAFT_1698387 [Lactarius quietus]|nr:hypothetical protein EI94DRAFT_1698387 [Lactarius quietus]
MTMRTRHDRRISNGITILSGVLRPRVRRSSVHAENYSRVLSALVFYYQIWKEWSRALRIHVGEGALKDEAQLLQRRYRDDNTHAPQKCILAYHPRPPAVALFFCAVRRRCQVSTTLLVLLIVITRGAGYPFLGIPALLGALRTRFRTSRQFRTTGIRKGKVTSGPKSEQEWMTSRRDLKTIFVFKL